MATINNITIEELTDIVTKSIDAKLQESMQRNQGENHSPNRHRNQDTSSNGLVRHAPRYQHYNNNNPQHYNNNNNYQNNYQNHNNYQNNNNSSSSYNNNSSSYGNSNGPGHYNNNIHYNNNSGRYNNNYISRGSNQQYQQNYHTGQSRPPSNPNSPNKYQPRLRRYEEVKPLKIMITYVETACTFWGQVLTPDLLDSTRQLETDLQDMCPGLPPVTHINKAGVYGTLWCDRWYRCITCSIPDEQGNTEVLFVDYGNKEKKNIADLVSLRSPKLMEVPFFAYPFRFPKLEAVPVKNTEAIKNFDTDSILTGFVSQTPCVDDYTDIFVNRPQNSGEHANCTTYNELMVELGFATKSEESTAVKRPQPSYYIQALQHRIKLLSGWCKEKDMEIARLTGEGGGGGGGGIQIEPKSPYQDIRYPSDENRSENASNEGADTPVRSVTPSNVNPEVEQNKQEEVVNGDGGVNEEADKEIKEEMKEEIKVAVVENKTVISKETVKTPAQNVEDEIQGYILSLIEKMEKYDTTAGQIRQYTDTAVISTTLQQLSAGEVEGEVEELRGEVELELGKLEESRSEIQQCTESGSLQLAVEKRDKLLLSLSQAVEKYLAKSEEAELQNKLQIVSEISESHQPSSSSTPASSLSRGDLPSLEEIIDSVREIEGNYSTSVFTLQRDCAEQLALLKEQFLNSATLLNFNFTRFGLNVNGSEELEKLAQKLSDKCNITKEISEDNTEQIEDLSVSRETITSLGETLRRISLLTEELLSTSSHYSDMLLPLSDSVRSTVYKKAEQVRVELEKHVKCGEDYAEKARSAQHALENKPDLSALNEIKKQLKSAKRAVKLAQITDEEDEEEEEGAESAVKTSMLKLHKLYEAEHTEFSSLLTLAETTHPELLIEHPQLNAMSQGDELLKTSWELHEFILPDTAACLNSQGLNVYSGFYSDMDPVYFVECPLQTVEGSLEDHAREIIQQTLPDCFAIILNKRNLRVYGATTNPPV